MNFFLYIDLLLTLSFGLHAIANGVVISMSKLKKSWVMSKCICIIYVSTLFLVSMLINIIIVIFIYTSHLNLISEHVLWQSMGYPRLSTLRLSHFNHQCNYS
ncbi:unnamed protein product [Citrullus colocynthis]|uniref:Uncharacterized protein n=1 Tax=Citrullus colocynthis TaxID=252529 RepID=A0ABP0YU96_9ROSI